MVGVITSNRCATCRKRKKKCDEKKPACSQCIQAGWECPGYQPNWKFVNESPRLAEHYASKRYFYESDSAIEEVHFTSETYKVDVSAFDIITWDKPFSTIPKLKVPRFIDPNPLASQFIFCMGCQVKGDLMPLSLLGSFIRLIPARLGRNEALDNSASCICSIYYYAPSLDQSVGKIYHNYSVALISLRQFLDIDDTKMEPETLCASILLQACELSVNVNRGEWSQLVLGTSSLIASRGRNRYKTAFERSMLHSQLSYIIGHSFRIKEPCYLETSEWQALLSEEGDWATMDPNKDTFLLKSQLCTILVHMPRLLTLYSKFIKLNSSDQSFSGLAELIILEASELITRFNRFISTALEPSFVARSSSALSTQCGLQYENVVLGVLDCVSNSSLVTLYRIVQQSRQLQTQFLPVGKMADWVQLIAVSGNIIGEREARALSAFHFVCGESRFAAKPLEFGIRQMQAPGLRDAGVELGNISK